MFAELMIELFGFIAEFIFEGFFEAVIDSVYDWAARRRK